MIGVYLRPVSRGVSRRSCSGAPSSGASATVSWQRVRTSIPSETMRSAHARRPSGAALAEHAAPRAGSSSPRRSRRSQAARASTAFSAAAVDRCVDAGGAAAAAAEPLPPVSESSADATSASAPNHGSSCNQRPAFLQQPFKHHHCELSRLGVSHHF